MTTSGAGAALRRLGRYHLADLLGGGPTGEVYRAKVYGVAGFERQFAVKRFHPELVRDPEVAARIAAAARLYGSLEHPRIARLHEYGVAGGDTFTATELVEGIDLGRLVQASWDAGEPLLAGAVAQLVSAFARAIGYAHGRGICHLGICPTNLICTVDGEVKVTDFGLLPPRLPRRPADDYTLRARIPYLAPEQIVSEPTSAATDVFQIGSVAHELFTGVACFRGASPFEVGQAILSSQPPEPDLPRPLLKVLQRCLARSPFERFPDAGALADALDAAVRTTPLPGGRRELGAAVRRGMEQLAAMHTGQASGALSFPLPAPPASVAATPLSRMLDSGGASPVPAPAPAPVAAEPPRPTAAPARPPGPAGTPPPVPMVRPAVPGRLPAIPPRIPAIPRKTTRGAVPAPVPAEPKTTPLRVGTAQPLSSPPAAERAPVVAVSHDEEVETQVRPPSAPPPAIPVEPSSPEIELAVADVDLPAPGPTELPLRPDMQPDIGRDPAAVRMDTAPPAGAVVAWSPMPEVDIQEEIVTMTGVELGPRPVGEPLAAALEPPRPPPPEPPPQPQPPPEIDHRQLLASDKQVPAGLLQRLPTDLPLPAPPGSRQMASQGGPRRTGLLVAVGVILVAGLGVGGYFGYQQITAGDDEPAGARAGDRPTGERIASKTGSPEVTGGPVAAAADASAAPRPADPLPPAAADAGAAPTEPDPPVIDGEPGKLSITSTPTGASVYMDGGFKGKTPLTLDGGGDSFSLALILPGYKLYTAEISGGGSRAVQLHEAVPPDGPAGIKVRCKRKNRYWVSVDGVEVGQLCPTERIGVEVGDHVVEIYDPETEQRSQFRVQVKGTRNSARVHID